MLDDYLQGLKAYSSAHKLVTKHNLWGFVILPGILSTLFFIGLSILGWNVSDPISAWLLGLFPATWEVASIGWLTTATNLLIFTSILLLGMFIVKYLVLIVLSPMLSYLSEKTEEIAFGGADGKMNLKEMLKDVVRAIRLNSRNLIRELVITFVLYIIPGVNVAAPVLVFFVQSYYGGFGLMDFTLERKRLNVSESIQFVRKRRGLALGLGTGYMLWSFVPIIGWFIGPTYGTIAATIVSIEAQKQP